MKKTPPIPHAVYHRKKLPLGSLAGIFARLNRGAAVSAEGDNAGLGWVIVRGFLYGSLIGAVVSLIVLQLTLISMLWRGQ